MKRGLLITILVFVLFFLTLFFIGGFIYFQMTSEPHVPEPVFLSITLDSEVVEHETNTLAKTLSIHDLWLHLRRAELDKRICGLYLTIDNVVASSASFEEFGNILNHFKKESKKPVVAFMLGGTIRDLYLASFADKVYTLKGNNLFIRGLAGQATFIKKTLDMLGVESEFLHIGAYKTAGNMYTHSEMTPEHRESFGQFFNDLHQSMVQGIAKNRHIEPVQVEALVQESPIKNETYLKAKLLDGICYQDETLDKAGFKDAQVFPFETYIKTSSPKAFSGKDAIAVLFADGEIHSGVSGESSLMGGKIMGAETVVAQLRRLRKAPNIKAVVLRINSPGGSALASDLIYREAELLAKEKPLVVSMGGLAASGGYWMSMAAQKVVCNNLTITGSIGVLFGKFNLKGLYDKIGITKEVIKTSTYADIFSDYRNFTQDERLKITQMMNELYDQFVNKVAKSRNMTYEQVHQIAQGRVWSGSRAGKIGLVDQMGGLWDATEVAAQLAKLTPNQYSVFTYPQKKDLFDMILDMLSDKGIGLKTSVKTVLSQFDAYKKSFFPAYLSPFTVVYD